MSGAREWTLFVCPECEAVNEHDMGPLDDRDHEVGCSALKTDGERVTVVEKQAYREALAYEIAQLLKRRARNAGLPVRVDELAGAIDEILREFGPGGSREITEAESGPKKQRPVTITLPDGGTRQGWHEPWRSLVVWKEPAERDDYDELGEREGWYWAHAHESEVEFVARV